jgi:hypothetical protein
MIAYTNDFSSVEELGDMLGQDINVDVLNVKILVGWYVALTRVVTGIIVIDEVLAARTEMTISLNFG